jgi:hypothetical protein
MAKKIRVWDGSAWQDVAPALPYTAVHSAQASMPSTAVDGQIWLDTDASVPSTTVTRWYKLPSAGTTTLSGNDDNSIPLAYTPGYEQVFLNGTLLSRSAADYTATTGTSVVLSSAIVAGDIVEIICPLQITTTDTYTQSATNAAFQANTNNFAAGKNKIINGDFGIWQRGTTFNSIGNFAYAADRTRISYDGSGTHNVTQQTFTPGAAPYAGYEGKFFFRFTQSTAGSGASYNRFTFSIEDVQTLAGQTATLSFWAKAGSAQTITTCLAQNFGTGGSTELETSAISHNLTTSWQRFSTTISVPSISGKTIGASNQVLVYFKMPLNVAESYDFWGIQLESGSNATAFQTATGNPASELAACQRYFEILDTTNQNDWIGDYYNTTTCYAPIFWKVTKRVAPTLTLPAASSFIVWNAGAANTPSAVGTDTLLTNGGSIYGVTSARTAGSAGRLRLSSNTISVSAEF